MKFFNLDCHVSVIADIKRIFEDLGHDVVSWSISGHNWIFGRASAQVDVVNQNTWRNLSDEMCDDFYERYKDELSQYDGFICTYPPSFSLLFRRFKKPIIIQIPIRYEVPFENNPNKWEKFNNYLRQSIDENKIFVVSNSEYDKKYFEFFVGRECQLIPNICEYTNTKWNPTKNQFLYCSRLPIDFDRNFIVNKSSLGRFEWSDLSQYKGMILIPYNCSTMSIFEYYTSNIPLFVPSKQFMKQLFSKNKNYVLSELTWNKTFNLPDQSSINCDRENDPNMFNNDEIMYRWIDYSDFYNEDWMPYITYFDSFQELEHKLLNTNLQDISDRMRNFNELRKSKIYDLWRKKIELISEKFSNR